MKNLFLAIAIAFSVNLAAQTEKKSKKIAVPAVIRETFKKEFPNKKVKWEMENADFEAKFKINGKDASAVYNNEGHQKALEIEIKKSELPSSALEFLKKNYPRNKINETEKITDDKNVITYESEIEKDEKSFDVLFDDKGNFIKIVEED